MHNIYIFENLDIIVCGDFFFIKLFLVQNVWIFQKSLWRSSWSSSNCFWQEIKIKCYELIVIMCQNDIKSNNILNWFQATTQTNINIGVINNLCSWSPLDTLVMLFLFYTNKETIGHNTKIFLSQYKSNIYAWSNWYTTLCTSINISTPKWSKQNGMFR
jgi:hypothetical protein